MAKYVTVQEIKDRLAGKVRFQDDSGADQSNRMSIALLNQLIDEAEGQVEMDLSPRYQVPFVSKKTGTFKGLDPKGTTINVIKGLCRIQCTMKVLETDFGSGTVVDAAKYIAQIEKRYKKVLDESILAKVADDYKDSRQWKFPPLLDLALNYFNREADDGFAGMIIHTTRGEGVYPSIQIDDPSENWFNADFNDADPKEV